MPLFIFTRTPVEPAEFVAYWSATYSYAEEHRYTDNIRGPHSPDGLRELFKWKVGKRFEESQMPAIEQHFISRIDEARRICADATAEQSEAARPPTGPSGRRNKLRRTRLARALNAAQTPFDDIPSAE